MIGILLKDTLRRVWKTKGRFLAILAIIALGCGFFAGVKVTSPDLKMTANNYYKDKNLMDIRLVSTFGFSSDEVERLSELDGVSGASGGYSADLFISGGDGQSPVARVYSLSSSRSEISPAYINRLTITEGRFPTAPNECIIEANTPSEYQVGGTLTLSTNSEDEPVTDVLRYGTYKIVGRASWVRYVDFERGTTTIGNGKVESWLVIPEEAFVSDYYTEVCITLDGSHSYDSFTEEYRDFVDFKMKELENLADGFHDDRITKTEKELSDAHIELDSARAELDKNQDEYDKMLAVYNGAIDDAKSQFDDVREELAAQEAELEKGKESYKSGLDSYAQMAASIGESKRLAENKIAQYSYAKSDAEQLRQLRNTLETFINTDWSSSSASSSGSHLGEPVTEQETLPEPITDAPIDEPSSEQATEPSTEEAPEVTTAETGDSPVTPETTTAPTAASQYDTYISILRQLDTAQLSVSDAAKKYASSAPGSSQHTSARQTLESVLADVNGRLYAADSKLASAQSEINSANAAVSSGQSRLNSAYQKLIDQKSALDKAENELKNAKAELAEIDREIENSDPESKAKLNDAASKLAKARSEIEENERKLANSEEFFYSNKDIIKWYVLDRSDDPGYASFGDDADRVDTIARIFPIFFILVAALVCFNTMTRMVEEQRTEIGTLKALGCGSGTIIGQFLLYAAAASIIGAVIGLSIGFRLFPKVIYNTYTIMYDYPDVICEFRWDYTIGCIIASLICTGLSALLACIGELRVQPAQLMRPKAPKSGKRVILERVPFIWKRLGFMTKVTARNVFRYKNRVLMTVLGIGGCTALMLAGFGLKHAISSIVDLQFGEILKYDAVCAFSAEDEEFTELHDNITSAQGISESLFVLQKSITVKSDNSDKEAYAMVPEAPDRLGDFVTLRDRKSREEYTLGADGVIINEKLASLLGVKVGDEIGFADTDMTVKITAITENYSQNYVYFTPELYTEVFGDYNSNIFWFMRDDTVNNEELSETILENSCVMAVNFMDSAGDKFRKMIKNLNAIVYVIIASSGALALVVLYNLSNINITERMRELATIKVLGFRDGELAAYIYRENTVSAIIGMLLGLFAGVFLTRFIVLTAEVDVVMFASDIPLLCFVLAASLTAAFTAAVNGLLYFRLKKIDMAGSMKAIE